MRSGSPPGRDSNTNAVRATLLANRRRDDVADLRSFEITVVDEDARSSAADGRQHAHRQIRVDEGGAARIELARFAPPVARPLCWSLAPPSIGTRPERTAMRPTLALAIAGFVAAGLSVAAGAAEALTCYVVLDRTENVLYRDVYPPVDLSDAGRAERDAMRARGEFLMFMESEQCPRLEFFTGAAGSVALRLDQTLSPTMEITREPAKPASQAPRAPRKPAAKP
jgi:hypothetical protein